MEQRFLPPRCLHLTQSLLYVLKVPQYVSREEINIIGPVYYINQKESVSDLKKGQLGGRRVLELDHSTGHVCSHIPTSTLSAHSELLPEQNSPNFRAFLLGISTWRLTGCQCLWHNVHNYIKSQHWRAIAVPFQMVDRYLTQEWDFLLLSSVHCFLTGTTRIGKLMNIWRSLSPFFSVGKHIYIYICHEHYKTLSPHLKRKTDFVKVLLQGK